MYLLDTDTLSHLHAGHERVAQRLAATAPTMRISIPIITKLEMLRGRIAYMLTAQTATDLLRAQALFLQTEHRLSQLDIIPFDEVAATRFHQLRAIKRLRKIGRADLLIASIALAQQATLVTRNVRHFRQIPHLSIENWVD